MCLFKTPNVLQCLTRGCMKTHTALKRLVMCCVCLFKNHMFYIGWCDCIATNTWWFDALWCVVCVQQTYVLQCVARVCRKTQCVLKRLGMDCVLVKNHMFDIGLCVATHLLFYRV